MKKNDAIPFPLYAFENFKKKFTDFLIKIADVMAFLKLILKNTFVKSFEWQEFFKQCYVIGNKSAGLISITGIIIGLVLTIS